MNYASETRAPERLFARSRIYAIPGLAILVLGIILFLHARPPLFADYAEWTYHGVLLRNVLQGHPDSAYALKNYPVPNSLTTVGLAALMLIMPWAAAAKLWLLIEVAVGLWCAARLQRASRGRQSWQLMVVTAGALLGVNLWYGFTNFQFSTYFAMLFGALLIEGFESGWIYGALLILLYFSHMIPFAFALCMLLLYALQSGRWKLLWQTIPSILLCLWYFAGKAAHGNVDADAGMRSSVQYGSLSFAAFRINTCLKCWGFVNPVARFYDSVLLKLIGDKLFVVFFAINVVIAMCVVLLAAMAAKRSISRQDPIRFFWFTALLFFLVGLVMPGAAAGISDPGARMIQVSLWCAACVIGARGKWIGRLLWGCSTALLVLNFYQIACVAERPPAEGTSRTSLPIRMIEFDHVEYSARSGYYDKISAGKMNAPIYPTAMFTERVKP